MLKEAKMHVYSVYNVLFNIISECNFDLYGQL